MDNMLQKIEETTRFLQQKGFVGAAAGIVLGTGLNYFIDKIIIEQAIPYQEIPNFPLATVAFHKGQLILGRAGNKKVIVMQGRFHYYEGYSMQEITFPIRVMKKLGIEYLLLSNAAGGMNTEFKKADIVIIADHINELPENPLRGLNDPAYGNRFVDMCSPYDQKLNERFKVAANRLGINIKTGIYVAVQGPNLETKAEYRLLKQAGADMVGMSTVPEVLVANHIGLPCSAVSVITDECDPDNLMPVNISEIIAVARKADVDLSAIFYEIIIGE